MKRAGGERDPWDRYYTPHWAASAVVRWARIPPSWTVVDPSVGQSSIWPQVLREQGHTGRIVGVDIDPDARAPAEAWCDEVITGDWMAVARERRLRADLVLGNPPYGPAGAHILLALGEVAQRGGFFLRGTFVELSGARLDLWRTLQPVCEWTITERVRARSPNPAADPPSGENVSSSMLWFRRGNATPGWRREVVSARRHPDRVPSAPPFPEVDGGVCMGCGNPVERPRGGRRPGEGVWCTGACRTAAWRARRAGVTRTPPTRHASLPLRWTAPIADLPPIVDREPTPVELELRGQLRIVGGG